MLLLFPLAKPEFQEPNSEDRLAMSEPRFAIPEPLSPFLFLLPVAVPVITSAPLVITSEARDLNRTLKLTIGSDFSAELELTSENRLAMSELRYAIPENREPNRDVRSPRPSLHRNRDRDGFGIQYSEFSTRISPIGYRPSGVVHRYSDIVHRYSVFGDGDRDRIPVTEDRRPKSDSRFPKTEVRIAMSDFRVPFPLPKPVTAPVPVPEIRSGSRPSR